MKKLLSVATAIILAVGFAMPLNAAPMFVSKPEQAQANVVKPIKNWKHGHGNRHWRHGNHWNNRYAWRNCGYYGSCYPLRYYGYRPGYYRPYYPGYYPRSGVSVFIPF